MRKRSMRSVAAVAVMASLVLPAVPTAATERQGLAPLPQCTNVYRYVGTSMTWDEARLAARSMGPGAHLATISSALENDCVVQALLSSDVCFMSRSARRLEWCVWEAWIGGSDARAEGIWRWIGTDGTGGGVFFDVSRERPRVYESFYDGQPDDWSTGEDCLEVNLFIGGGKFVGVGGVWNDAFCSDRSGFVVEFERRVPRRGALPA